MTSNFLQPCITEPTRIIQGNRPSIVDNIFTIIFDKELYSGNLLDKITDHLPNFLIIKNIKNNHKNKKIKIRHMKNFDHDKYLSDLEELDNFNWLQFEDVDEVFNAYQNKFIEIINKNAPYITLSKKASKKRQKPWITSGILKSIKYKNKLFGKFIKPQEKFWYERYKYHLQMINKLISKSKKSYFRKFLQENQSKSKIIWTKINEIIQSKRREHGDIFINSDGKIISDNKKIANEFNNYYINVAQNFLKNLGETNNKFQDYLKNPNEHNMFLKETDLDEVYKILKNLDVKKATDTFGIPPKLVTMAANTLKNQIPILFNLSITQEICPDKLKTGQINPVHKFESKTLYSNYRPISILPLFSKVFERLMFNRIYNFVIKHEIIYKNQFGFQNGKSTEHAILDLYTNLLQAIEKHHKTSCIFLDFAKAFDTLNHDILTKILEYILWN